MVQVIDPAVPERVAQRLEVIEGDLQALAQRARACLQTELRQPLSMTWERERDGDLFSDPERAQLVSFVVRFDNLPEVEHVRVVRAGEHHYLANLSELRHTLHEYRSIVANERDPIFYRRIHGFFAEKLTRADRTEGTRLQVVNREGQDVTSTFIPWLGDHQRAVQTILDALDLDYLYNGVLQHADARHSVRLVQDYTSGELQYTLFEHARAVSMVKVFLRPYRVACLPLIFLKPGPL